MRLLGLIPLLFAQLINTGGYRKLPAAPCSPPTMTSRWAAYNPANTCTNTGASPCTTNGQIAWGRPDFNSVNNMGRLINSDNPVFTTNAINSTLPSDAFSSTPGDFFNLTIADTITTYTFYAVIKLTTTASNVILGPTSNGGIVWLIDSSANQSFGLAKVAGPFNGTATYSTGTWYTVALEWNSSTGAYTFFKCSGGACATDGSGSSGALTISNNITFVGQDNPDGWNLNGQIAELGFLNGTSIAGIGAWSFCKYGV